MTIKRNLERTHVAVTVDTYNGGDLADRIGQAAIAAITKGMGSPEWRRYMALFCDDANELAQLTVVRDTDLDYMPHMRAYIVSNAVCVADTGTQTANGVNQAVEPAPAALVPEGTPNPANLREELGFEIP